MRVLLGIAKLAGAIVLIATAADLEGVGLATALWVAAVVAHYLAGDGAVSLPVALLGRWRFRT